MRTIETHATLASPTSQYSCLAELRSARKARANDGHLVIKFTEGVPKGGVISPG